jgi:hypothetical protein
MNQDSYYKETIANPVVYNNAGEIQRVTDHNQRIVAQPSYPQNYPLEQNQRQRPLNGWADSICDWPKNLFPSCWCALCCCYGVYITAQSKCVIFLFSFSLLNYYNLL